MESISTIRQKILRVLSTEPYKFIEKIDSPSIEIHEDNAKASLSKIIVENINYESSVDSFWLIHLEKDIPGFTPKSKTVEKALIHIQEKILAIYLIEMKSSIKHDIKKSVLNQIKEKIQDTISRFYTLSMHNNSFYDGFDDLEVKFKGVIFYRQRLKTEVSENSKIYQIFTDTNQEGLLECETILGLKKIPVKFFHCQDETTTVDFNKI
ncbi:MAG: hypothetical protein NW226_18120 [Microscillaceae bacterium]|nr:hypothetical protein [Microscillaceae bacterium]